MARLIPLPFEVLLEAALEGHDSVGRVFGVPRRSFRTAAPGADLALETPGGPAATPLGIAAGPHTQLAQNIVMAWLAGARAFELKTVQADDRLEIPRPCIAAGPPTLNVEWSQELRLEDSAAQYVAAWLLVHVLRARGWSGGADEPVAFDASVGYDLAGLRSDGVARFLDTLTDAAAAMAAMRARLPARLAGAADVAVPARVVRAVTVSTFHGAPADELEGMVEHLFDRHGLDVIVKLNPALLGRDDVERLLRGRLEPYGLAVDRDAFAGVPGWSDLVARLGRLDRAARRRGRRLGVKVANTLPVRPGGGPLPGDVAYLSGAPLHALAVTLGARVAEATGGRLPIALSGGVEAERFADAVACGFAPVTTCSDLLQPTGYRRLPRYLAALEAEMHRAGAGSVAELVVARARENGVVSREPVPATRAAALGPDASDGLRLAALANLRALAGRLARRAPRPAPALPPPRRAPLPALDCDACNACALVCPNGAFLRVRIPSGEAAAWDVVVEDGAARARPARFAIAREDQWAVFAGLCNACGACDAHCPQAGPPHLAKPRLHLSAADYAAEAPADGVLVEQAGARLRVRAGGAETRIERAPGGTRFADGAIEAELDGEGRVRSLRADAPGEGHALQLGPLRALVAVVEAALAEPGPLRSAASAPAPAGTPTPPRPRPASP